MVSLGYLDQEPVLITLKNPPSLHKQFSIRDSFSKCDQIRRKMRIWSHLLKKSFLKNFIFCAVYVGRFTLQGTSEVIGAISKGNFPIIFTLMIQFRYEFDMYDWYYFNFKKSDLIKEQKKSYMKTKTQGKC